ncbi:MAG: hypothetical protein K6F04_01585, partial [bacterium]|nr:hypothetical protein [bacterium]
DDGKVLAYGDSGCGSNTELLCVDDIGFNANTFTESKVAEVQWSDKPFLEVTAGTKTGSLEAGFYKVVVAGAKGGGSGKTGAHMHWCGGMDNGGLGDVQERVFSIDSSKSFTAKVGAKGSKGSDAGALKKGGTGGRGGSSTFTAGSFSLTATGGYGAEASGVTGWFAGCNNKAGANSGNGGNPNENGYIKVYKQK